ncbi:MAG: hypothetical protein LBF77_04135 [Spirochaetaceae bacterium]|jgi:hypothetical protein|nr:hypothetical protein [Spirochaetaceae bacterium]
MTMHKTIEKPAGRRINITLDIPGEIPLGLPLVLTYTFTPVPNTGQTEAPDKFDAAARSCGYQDHLDYLGANTPVTIEEAIAQARAKLADPRHRNFFRRHYGAVQGVYGDGMEYQRTIRDEWPD